MWIYVILNLSIIEIFKFNLLFCCTFFIFIGVFFCNSEEYDFYMLFVFYLLDGGKKLYEKYYK